MAKVKLPGVYFEDNPRVERGVSMGETGVPAFLGVATKGPLNEPVVIQSVQQFLRYFGQPVKGSYLYASIWGFFMNGGTRCHVPHPPPRVRYASRMSSETENPKWREKLDTSYSTDRDIPHSKFSPLAKEAGATSSASKSTTQMPLASTTSSPSTSYKALG